MTIFKDQILLTSDQIITEVEKISQVYLDNMKSRAVPITRIKLTTEELLLNLRACVGDGKKCDVSLKKEFGKIRIELITSGSEFDITGKSNEMYDGTGFSNYILQRFDIAPKYEHSNVNGGTNKISLVFEKKPVKNKFLYLMIASLLLAIAVYFGLTNICNQEVLSTISDASNLIFSKLVSIIAAVATPLVFFSVITGILGLGDANTFGKVGKIVLLEMLISYILSAVLFGSLGGIFYYTGGNSIVGENVVSQVLELVLDMIPSNLVEPFATENDLQVITFSIFSGFILLLIRKSVPIVEKVSFELSSFFNKMMGLVCKLLPGIVFFGIFNMLLSGTATEVIKVYKAVLIIFAVSLIIMVTLTIRTCVLTKVKFTTMIKKQIPAFLVTLTTSSQVAAIPENMVCFKEKFGIDKDFADFAFPLGVVIYMPCGAAFLGITTLSLAALAGVDITLSLLIKITIVSVVLAIAAPPIPGAAFAVMPIAFAACGVPNSVYPIAIVLGTVIAYFLPALNCYCLQLKTLISAYRLGKVDTDILYRE